MNTQELYESLLQPKPDKEINKRISDMKMLRFIGLKSLQEIADIYGISRERVRQLIGNTGSGFVQYGRLKKIIKGKNLTNKELATVLGVGESSISHYRSSFRHKVDDGAISIGYQAEEFISGKLKEIGIENKLMPIHHPFDILLSNGKKIDVKSRLTRSLPPSQTNLRNGIWRFNIKKNIKGNYCDFFILVLEMREIFVIPNSEVKNDHIAFSWPPSVKPSKWHKYYNKFELLK